jgi:carboxylesterase type B
MRQVPVNLITNFWGQYADNGTTPSLFFRPVVDERVVFSNTTQRAEAGLIARVPALVSTTANEDSSLVSYPVNNLIAGPNATAVTFATLSQFVCPAFFSKNVRAQNNLSTYRYQYAGNYSSVTPLWWMGAYHASDEPMIFGTYNFSGRATGLQQQVADTMQDDILAFISDPENGLRSLGWLPDESASGENGPMVRFGAGDSIVTNIDSTEVDNPCLGRGVYNSSPST